MKLIGVDVGGTFTDVVLTDTDTQQTHIHKVPTTPHDPSEGVLQGIVDICTAHGIDRRHIDHVLHGTTIATNAVLEQNGAVAGMVTSAGYRDIVHIGRHQRPQHYSIQQEVPWQDRILVKRRYRKTVSERRIPPSGAVLTPLDENEVRQAARELQAAGVDAVAVCFLFSYIDPSHEVRAAEIIREEFPQAFVTTSASVSPQFREFERFTTATMNAYIGPKVATYVNTLESELKQQGVGGDLHIMGSNGGVATANMVLEKPILTVLSGPAAGVLGGLWTGALSERNNLITFDVGGTSADIGIVRDGTYAEATARDTWIAGYPLMVTMMDIHTIGAGGGSIAYVDHGGAFKVGPRSAGAVPGPAAYRRGGTEPTVTDANVVLGRLDPDNFLGGAMQLDMASAHQVIRELAGQLGLGVDETAEGVLTILNANMANAIRSRTVQKGIDPRDFSLVAFGGAGPLHGAEVAAQLGIPEIIVPPYPGITSAVGLLTTDLKYDLIKTEFQVQGHLDFDKLNADLAGMESELHAQLAAAGIEAPQMQFVRAGDLRYVGQGYELRVNLPAGEIDANTIEQVWRAFDAVHEKEYGHVFPDNPIEIVNVRLTGIGVMPKIGPPTVAGGLHLNDAVVRTGRCLFRVGGALESFETPFYAREKLPLEQPINGPAIILQTDTTTVVPPACRCTAHADGNLIITLES
ncbi:MAG: hydantoin utilization protein A [Candidatus Entotheonella factor]|uniref:Hydantoin utilization protein A n=1 Tax=Entotheonella factor TaxID=1429438 RepID=W4L527_ENTF1|nr:MAG: hydantoin utilization protein A [Candidatus Entotheonella factor]